MRRLVIPAVTIGLIVFGGFIWTVRTVSVAPRAVLEPSALDFGPVNTRAIRTVTLRNAGRGSLRVLAVSTSCGCTTAAIEADTVPPRGTTRLTVTFDSAAHGPQAGPANHAVYLRTNDPRTPEAELPVYAVVVKTP
jgi:hypothetical protein